MAALFLKLPEIRHIFTACKTCSPSDPYTPLIGAGYFALLIALSLLFPTFPNPPLARGGVVWALLLALVLTSINPIWCSACLVGHLCNIAIWSLWLLIPPTEPKPTISLGARLSLILFIPLSVVALFSSLNLTFLAYKTNPSPYSMTLHKGDPIPTFTAQTTAGRPIANTDGPMILNFVTPDCPYCEEQLQALRAHTNAYRFINISPTLTPELTQYAPATDWIEDKGSQLRKLFKVYGNPTLFIVGSDGKISRIIYGVPEGLSDSLEISLKN